MRRQTPMGRASTDLFAVLRLAFIRRCRSLDMALDEVRVLLGFKDVPRANCSDVNA